MSEKYTKKWNNFFNNNQQWNYSFNKHDELEKTFEINEKWKTKNPY
jgi:hypothetical protein